MPIWVFIKDNMTVKDQKFIDNWEKVLKMGRTKYALINGFFYGILTFGMSSLIVYFGFGDKRSLETSRIVIQLVLFFIIGFLLFYKINWKTNNIKYNSLKINN